MDEEKRRRLVVRTPEYYERYFHLFKLRTFPANVAAVAVVVADDVHRSAESDLKAELDVYDFLAVRVFGHVSLVAVEGDFILVKTKLGVFVAFAYLKRSNHIVSSSRITDVVVCATPSSR